MVKHRPAYNACDPLLVMDPGYSIPGCSWRGFFPFDERDMIDGMLAAISVNKGCHSHQRLQPSNVSRRALRKPRKERTPAT